MGEFKRTQVSLAMSNIYVLAKAIIIESQIIKENMSQITDKDDSRATKELLQKCNFYISRMDSNYTLNSESNQFIAEQKGESAINELSLRLLDNLYEMAPKLKANDTKPE